MGGVSTSCRSGSVSFFGGKLSGVGSLSVSVAEGEDELVERSSGPECKQEEDGLGISSRANVKKTIKTYEELENTKEDLLVGGGTVGTYIVSGVPPRRYR